MSQALCGLCGKPANGYARAGDVVLCHPDFGPSCYIAWTVYDMRPGGRLPRCEVDDGFGSTWTKCLHPLCDLQVVRPGKVQCSDWCEHHDDNSEAHVSAEHVLKLIAHAKRLEEDIDQLLNEDGAL